MRIDMAIMLRKAEQSKISEAELKEVLYRIENLADKPNLERLLIILGVTRRFEYKHVLEKFLVYPENPEISRCAFEILAQDWGMAKYYVSYIKEMMRGVDWDEAGYVRSIAISTAAYYFDEINDKEILKILLEIFENEYEERRGEAYKGILMCLGIPVHEIIRMTMKGSPKFLDKKLMAETYELLNRKK